MCRTYEIRDIYDNNVVTANILMRIQPLSTVFCKISGIFWNLQIRKFARVSAFCEKISAEVTLWPLNIFTNLFREYDKVAKYI